MVKDKLVGRSLALLTEQTGLTYERVLQPTKTVPLLPRKPAHSRSSVLPDPIGVLVTIVSR